MANEKPKTNDELHTWGMNLVDDGRMGRRAWEGIWWENIATYVGDLWTEYSPHERKLLEPVRKADHKVRLPINLAQPVVRTELAKLVKNRPILDVLPRSDDRKDLNAAEVGDKMLNTYIEREFNMPRVRRRALHWVLLCGLGGIFVDWDDKAEASIEVFSDPRGEPIMNPDKVKAYQKYHKRRDEKIGKMNIPNGEMAIKAISPFQLIWDFSKIYFEDAWWCILSEVYDCNDAERRWGTRPEADDGALPGVIERRLLSKMDLTGRLSMEAPKAQDLCEIHRLYVKPGHPFFPKGAHVAFTKDEILKRENFPHGHKKLPIALMGHIPLPTSQYSMSVVQQVRPVVLEVSKTESQLIENRNLMANPPWLIPNQVQMETEIQNKPGLRLRYTHIPNVPPPSPVQMPEMPVYVQNLVETLKNHILEISGQGETSQGRVPPGARSGVAIAYLQEEDDTRLGPTVSEFEEMMELTGFLTLETIAEKYTIPRTVRLYRRHGDPEVFDFVGTMIEGNTGVVAQAGSALPRSKAAKQQFILDLWDRKLEQDPRRVREMLELSTGEPDEWQIDLDHAERENRKLREGQPGVAVEEWHNHPAHLYKHYSHMKSADFEADNPTTQQAFRDHCTEHEQFDRAQKQQMMPPEGMGGLGGMATNGAAANGQQVPEGPSGPFAPSTSPRSLLDDGPA